MFRSWMFPYADPSTFPMSVPVFADTLPRSAAFMNISMSVGVEEAFVGSGRPINVDIGCLKISASHQLLILTRTENGPYQIVET